MSEDAELNELLDPEEYRLAKESVLSAHYTPKTIIDGIYNGLSRMGFIKGKILEPAMGMPEERFELLAKNYETEQTELKEKVIRVKSSLTVAEENDSSIAKFISLVRSYTEVNELTPEILNSFIDKIYIGKPERINGQRVQEVKIVYKLVGAVNIPQ